MSKIYIYVRRNNIGKYNYALTKINSTGYLHAHRAVGRRGNFGGMHYDNINDDQLRSIVVRIHYIENGHYPGALWYDSPEEALCNLQRIVGILSQEDLED